MNHVAVNVSAVAEDVAHHCEQAHGASSYRITGLYDDVIVYLTGTPTDIMRFARALTDQVIAQMPESDRFGAALMNTMGITPDDVPAS